MAFFKSAQASFPLRWPPPQAAAARRTNAVSTVTERERSSPSTIRRMETAWRV